MPMWTSMQRWWRTRRTDLTPARGAPTPPLSFYGSDYGGWSIDPAPLSADSVVLSFGIGEDITFDQALVRSFGLTVHGFDPTPKALAYVAPFESDRLVVHPWGLGARDEERTFHLPKNPSHVSGSIANSGHVQDEAITVPMRSLTTIADALGLERVDVLKMDIEGSEYEALRDDATLARIAGWRPQLLVEFHHRFNTYDKADTRDIVARLAGIGYAPAWVSRRGEEALFLPDHG